jgi:hypothetical protein
MIWEEFGSNGGIITKDPYPGISNATIYRSSTTPAWLEWTIWTDETKDTGEAVTLNGYVRDRDSFDRAKEDCERVMAEYAKEASHE